MALSEVATLAGLVMSTASMIQSTGNNWYKASASWEDFPRQVERLRRKQEFWEKEFTKFGLLSDRSLIQTLQEAHQLLDHEKEKLSKKSASCGAGCWPKLSMTMFPAQLGLTIENVIRAFDDIQALLTSEEEAAVALEKRQMRRPYSMLVRKDLRYVPLKTSETAVYSALDKVNLGDTPVVILLHGGPGKGKSTLASAVALHYKETQYHAVFKQVLYLECGPTAEILDKEFNLLQLLGTVAAAPQEQARQGDSNADFEIRRKITPLLKDEKVLIILDDVCHKEFLEKMVSLCGKEVKCLVTSQRKDLCEGLNCALTEVPMQDVQQEDARKILASHVGLPNQLIPKYLEGIADEMIQETEGNPLALASIAAGIDNTRANELDAWEAARTDLFDVLRRPETPAHMFNKKYPRSFWKTMKLSFDSLKKDAQDLLILVHICGGLSVPEEVIEILHRSLKVGFGSVTLTRSRKELEARELVKITVVSESPDSPEKQRSWSIHSLHKRFIEEEMKDAKETTFSLLTGLSYTDSGSIVELKVVKELSLTDKAIMITLASLYLDDEFARRAQTAAAKMGIPSHRFSKLRCSAIEPITRLLGHPISHNRWSEKLHTSAKRVFMGYIGNCELNDDGISNLLVSPASTLAMMAAIEDIATVEKTTLLEESTHNFVKTLIALMEGVDDKGNPTVQTAAFAALFSLCNSQVRSVHILNKVPIVLESVVRLLLTDPRLEIRSWSARILASLTVSNEVHILQTIVQYPGALHGLVKSLAEEESPTLQRDATFALANIACGSGQTRLEIAKSFGALEELVKLLSKDDNLELQREAARALANLAGGEGETKSKITNSSSTMEVLMNKASESNETNLEVQKHAERALRNLICQDGESKLESVSSLDLEGSARRGGYESKLESTNSLDLEGRTSRGASSKEASEIVAQG